MSKNLNLFGEEELQQITITPAVEENILPLIFLEKKKASKNDSPLEKEIRRFNRLLKELNEYEAEQQKKVFAKDEYDKLFISEIVPQLRDLAEVQFLFVRHIEDIFYESNPGKKTEKLFVALVVDVLQQAAVYNDEAKKLLQIYSEREVNMLSKSERKQFEKWQAGENNEESFDEKNEEGFAYEHTHENFSNKQHYKKVVPQAPKVDAPVSINELYKELVKMIHPDKEQDAHLKIIKNNLMTELNAAKNKADLFAMLLIKQKAFQLNKTTPDESNYSLEQLKAYNKVLKQKLDLFRKKLENELFGSMYMQNGFINMKPLHTNATERLAKELHKLKKVKKDINHNIKAIKTAEDIEILLYNY